MLFLVKNHPFIIWASNTQGVYDYNIIMTAKNPSHFNRLEKEIKKIPEVQTRWFSK